MNDLILTDAQRLEGDAETIKQGLECLTRDCSAWARKREEKDLVDLVEDLKGAQMDVSLMLTDSVELGYHCEEKVPKVVFHDLHDLFSCLDSLFNDLKKARGQLREGYIPPFILEHLEVKSRRFRKVIGQVRRHLKERGRQTATSLKGFQVHLPQGHATAL